MTFPSSQVISAQNGSSREEPSRTFRIGLTEKHGMARELSQFPPKGVTYSFLERLHETPRMLRSSIKGYLSTFNSCGHDLIEAIFNPILTDHRWIYSLANFQEATAFSFLRIPTPRFCRVAFIKHLLLKDNFRKLIFWSEAGKRSLTTYGGVHDRRVLDKTTVVYPAIHSISDDARKRPGREIELLFSGDFFRKGGVNVIDAFEKAQKKYTNLKLWLCCDEKIDFNTRNAELRDEYLHKIKNNQGIAFGRIPRHVLMERIMPRIDIYLLPTYIETFGFALLEAMAYGIPIISSTYFAIPEIVAHNVNGFLINTDAFDCDQLFRGYVVNNLPGDFREYMTHNVYEHLCELIESPALRERMGKAGLEIAKSKFTFEMRNKLMLRVYEEALS